MGTREFTDEELYVLECVVEDGYSFAELVWLGTKERQIERAPQVLLSFLRRDLIELYERRDSDDGEGRLLSSDEAEAATLDVQNWRDPLEEGALGQWYMAYRTDAGQDAYTRAYHGRSG